VSFDEDNTADIPLLTDDVDNDPLTTNIVTLPLHGTVSFTSGSSTAHYVPDNNYHGPDNFTFSVSDGLCTSTAARVSITVGSVNDAPQAVNDAYTASRDTTLTVAAAGVLLNDSDADSSPLSAQLVAAPTSGSLVLNGDGSFVYVPSQGFVGTDTFTYRASDGSGSNSLSEIATVTIAVSGDCAEPSIEQPCADKPELTLLWTRPAESKTKGSFVKLGGLVVVTNEGDVDSGPFTAELYLSANACMDENAVLLSSKTVKKLKPGKFKKIKVRRKKTSPDVPVNGFVIAVIDRLDEVDECNENNNALGSGPVNPSGS